MYSPITIPCVQSYCIDPAARLHPTTQAATSSGKTLACFQACYFSLTLGFPLSFYPGFHFSLSLFLSLRYRELLGSLNKEGKPNLCKQFHVIPFIALNAL